MLGRPFLKIAKTKIDVDKGTLSFESDYRTVNFNMFDSINSSSNMETVYHIGILEPNELTSMHDTIVDLNEIECENPVDLSDKQLCMRENETSNAAIADLPNTLHNPVYLGNGETLPIS